MVPIFTNAICNHFKSSVTKAIRNFQKNMESFTLINKTHLSISWKSKEADPLQPPDTLLEFYPLAEFLNQILIICNELRLCAPIALINFIVKHMQESLSIISKSILILYGQEQQAFTSNSRDAFTRLCMSFSDDMIPYIQKCIHILYPPSNVAAHIGIDVQTLQKENISFLNKSAIVEPIKHLLPVKSEPIIHSLVDSTLEKSTEESVKDESAKAEDDCN